MVKNEWLWVIGIAGVIGVGYYLYTNPTVLALGKARSSGGGGAEGHICDEGELRYIDCWDGTRLTIGMCHGNTWWPTGQTGNDCPAPPHIM